MHYGNFKIHPHYRITVNASLELNEDEMRALDALVGYGFDAFWKHFGEKLGKAYMRDHIKGLKTFFEKVKNEIPPMLYKCDQARKAVEPKPK